MFYTCSSYLLNSLLKVLFADIYFVSWTFQNVFILQKEKGEVILEFCALQLLLELMFVSKTVLLLLHPAIILFLCWIFLQEWFYIGTLKVRFISQDFIIQEVGNNDMHDFIAYLVCFTFGTFLVTSTQKEACLFALRVSECTIDQKWSLIVSLYLENHKETLPISMLV